jgi:uncharacterized protein YndB with AHSA1/START domain
MATTGSKLKVSVQSDLEIVMTREFDAPRELVFQAFTDPELIPQWWGQRNTTTIVDKMDVRPGGGWRFISQGQNGEEYAFRGEFLEIVPPERVVQTFEFEPIPGHIVTDAANFEERNGKTLVTVVSTFASKEDRDGMIESGMEAGAAESYDRLEELLATLV